MSIRYAEAKACLYLSNSELRRGKKEIVEKNKPRTQIGIT